MLRSLIFFLAVQHIHAAVPAKLEAHGGRASFLAIGKPSFIHIDGKGSSPSGRVAVDKDGKVSGEIAFALKTLDTGIDLRNRHIQEKYLETGKFPEASLKLTNLELDKSWSLEHPEVKSRDFKGELKLHGVSRPVEGTFEMDAKRAVQAKFKLKLSDFAITIPSYMGVTVADEVQVEVEIHEMQTVN